jgi:hypothetical protein
VIEIFVFIVPSATTILLPLKTAAFLHAKNHHFWGILSVKSSFFASFDENPALCQVCPKCAKRPGWHAAQTACK